MAVAKSIFKSIFKSYSRAAIGGGEGGIPGLLSLWNAKAPSTCPVGPQIQTSVAGLQPDANGNMVPWPVNHPGKGVMVQPAYSNLFNAGDDDFFDTGWSLFGGAATVGGAIVIPNGGYIRHSAGLVLSAGAKNFSVDFTQISGTVKLKIYDSDALYSSGDIATVGRHDVSATTIAAGTAFYIWNESGAETVVTPTKPILTASLYVMPYAPPATSVTSTASTSGGNGLAIPLNAAMTAALSGGAFTAAALVEMGVSSAQITAPANILSGNDVAAGLVFADSGGKLKCTDGTNTAEVTVAGGWARTDKLLPVVQCDGSEFRIGYAKNTFSAITWGTAVAVGADGDWDVVTHERIGLDSTIVFGAQQVQFWGKVTSEAGILRVANYA